MTSLHRFMQVGVVWPVTCETCGRGWLASHLPPDYPGGAAWLVYDERAIEIVRTSRLAARLSQVVLRHDRRGWVTCQRGLVLAVVAHHHARGLAYDVTDIAWITVTLLTLNADGSARRRPRPGAGTPSRCPRRSPAHPRRSAGHFIKPTLRFRL